jgi:hypothetical protein
LPTGWNSIYATRARRRSSQNWLENRQEQDTAQPDRRSRIPAHTSLQLYHRRGSVTERGPSGGPIQRTDPPFGAVFDARAEPSTADAELA